MESSSQDFIQKDLQVIINQALVERRNEDKSGFLKEQSLKTIAEYARIMSEILMCPGQDKVQAIDQYANQIDKLMCFSTMWKHGRAIMSIFDTTYQFYQLLFEGANYQIDKSNLLNKETLDCYHYKFNLKGCMDGNECTKSHNKNIDQFHYVICLLEILKRKHWPEVQQLCKDGSNCTNTKQCQFRHLEPGQVIKVTKQLKNLTEPRLVEANQNFEKLKQGDLTLPKCNLSFKCPKTKQGKCPYAHPVSIEEYRSTIDCSDGAECTKHASGKCQFKHPSNDNPTDKAKPVFNFRTTIKCNKGDRCKKHASGKCQFVHTPIDNLTEETKQSSKQETVKQIDEETKEVQVSQQVVEKNNEKPKKPCYWGSNCRDLNSGCKFSHTEQDAHKSKTGSIGNPNLGNSNKYQQTMSTNNLKPGQQQTSSKTYQIKGSKPENSSKSDQQVPPKAVTMPLPAQIPPEFQNLIDNLSPEETVQEEFYRKVGPIFVAVTEINPHVKQHVGTVIFQFVHRKVGQEKAPKVTGILTELSISEIKKYLVSYDQFVANCDRAMQLLAQEEQTQKSKQQAVYRVKQ